MISILAFYYKSKITNAILGIAENVVAYFCLAKITKGIFCLSLLSLPKCPSCLSANFT
jgi:hypothetical protein